MRFFLPVIFLTLIVLFIVFKVVGKDVHSEKDAVIVEKHYFKTVVVEPVLRPVVISGYGLVDALQRYFIYSQVQGEVTQKVARDGEILQKGDEILRLNSDVEEIHLESLKALLEERRTEYQAAKELNEAGYLPAVKLSGALAGLKKAEADLKALEKQIEKHIIKAPVSGVLGKINVAQGDVVAPGVTLLVELIPFGDYVVRMNVSEKDVFRLKKGLEAEVMLPGLGATKGKTRFVSIVSDNATKTFPVEIHIDQGSLDGRPIPVGVIADSKIVVGDKLLYKLPGSALFLGESRDTIIKVVREGTVKWVHVDVIEEEGEDFWIFQDTLEGKLEVVAVGGGFLGEDEKLTAK